jgi:hypothetical protein
MAGINLDVSGLKVLLEPVSAQTFSLTVPSAVPAVVEVLATGPQGPGVPFFGNTDDVLVKASDVSFDTEWTDEITVDAVQFDVAADEGEPVTGQLVWNAEEGTLDLGLNGVEGTFLHVGQEEMFRVSNRTGATIAKGKVVGFGGTIGQSGKLLGVLFDASSAPAKTIMGVAADDIPDDADGYVVAFGKVRKVKTDFVGWVEGDILFADPAVPGGLTRVQPQSPNAIVTVAALVTRSAQVGELFVRPTFAGALSETQDVRLTAPADGEVLAYDGALGLWVNEPVPADAVQSVNGQTGTVVLDAADVGAYADDNPSGFRGCVGGCCCCSGAVGEQPVGDCGAGCCCGGCVPVYEPGQLHRCGWCACAVRQRRERHGRAGRDGRGCLPGLEPVRFCGCCWGCGCCACAVGERGVRHGGA